MTDDIDMKLLTEKEVAELLNLQPATLRTWRYNKRGPKFVRVEGAVRYRLEDVLSCVEDGQ